jgi:hypothetical protein
MKSGLCNLGNSHVIVPKRKVLWTITYNGIEDFSTILGHVTVSKVITFKINFFEKYKVCDELYNSLLCVIKVKKTQSPSHIPMDVIHDQY